MRDENELSPEVANFYKKMEEALETIKREEYDGAHKQLIEGKALTWKARTVLQKRGIPLSSSVLEEWNDIFDEETRKALYKEQKSSTTIVKDKKVYPNDPCPCGSGKKYKKCCGKNK